jgi:hypothetical protein
MYRNNFAIDLNRMIRIFLLCLALFISSGSAWALSPLGDKGPPDPVVQPVIPTSDVHTSPGVPPESTVKAPPKNPQQQNLLIIHHKPDPVSVQSMSIQPVTEKKE